jgi:catechol 2,3-dioxygenase-like lactoylglutathione lyase family enzyme
MITMKGLHHVAICVTDLERSKRFYGGILGLTEIDRPRLHVQGAWYALASAQIHLIVHPSGHSRGTTAGIDIADPHVAFRIHDFAGAVAHLRAHGLTLLERPDNATPWKQVYFMDPDGNVIELNVDRDLDDAGNRVPAA